MTPRIRPMESGDAAAVAAMVADLNASEGCHRGTTPAAAARAAFDRLAGEQT